MKRALLLVFAFAVAASMAAAPPQTVTFTVEGWTCSSCAAATRITLKKLDGVESVETDHGKGEAVVRYDASKTSPAKMVEAIGKLGYRASIRGKAASAGLAGSATTTVAAAGDASRMLFFEVPLGCPAVEGLGCGSLATPILAELEKTEGVADARLNHGGSVLAVTWERPGGVPWKVARVESTFRKRGLDAALVEGEELQRARGEYTTGRWYRSAELERLSEEESRVVAARIVARVEKGSGLSPERAEAFRRDVAATLYRLFIGKTSRREELGDVAERYLDRAGVERFVAALRRGLEKLPDDAL